MSTAFLNPYNINLQLLTFSYNYDVLTNVIDAQISAINKATEYYEREAKSGDEQFLEIIAEEQGDIIESLIGCSFVACQVYITQIITRIREIHRDAEHEGKKLTTTSESKADIRKSCSPIVPNSSVGYVEAINALADYFKHSDEWDIFWADETKQAKSTIAVVQSLGLKQSSTRNLTRGLEALGGDLQKIPPILRKWRNDLNAAYLAELRSLKLVP